MRRLTKEEFVSRAMVVHGNKYDYSKVMYVNRRTKVCIICKKCGEEFLQNPPDHLKGCGCKTCAFTSLSARFSNVPNIKGKKLIYGIAVNDLDICAANNTCYSIWHGILQRTINKKYTSTHDSYKDACLCDEWLYFSNFKKWFDLHYIDGYHIDKDVLSVNGKVYSPDTCIFLPSEINTALSRERKKRDLPIGVMHHNDKFKAVCRLKYLGLFDNVEDARNAYLKAKKQRITDLANKWKDKIEPRVYDALVNLDVHKFFNN